MDILEWWNAELGRLHDVQMEKNWHNSLAYYTYSTNAESTQQWLPVLVYIWKMLNRACRILGKNL
jgi:hypothetical protein